MEVRPITREEALRFSRIGNPNPKIFQKYLETLWDLGESFPGWCFIGEKKGRALGRVAYWALPSQPQQAFLFGLSLPWKKNYREVGRELLLQSSQTLAQIGFESCQAGVYQERSFVLEKKRLFEDLDFSMVQKKHRMIREKRRLTGRTGGLDFRPLYEVGEETFVQAIQGVTRKTLDRLDQKDLEKLGEETTARNYFVVLRDLDYNPQWWYLAYSEKGNLVGLVVPQELEKGLGCINYIGVLPEFRGHGYGRILLSWGVSLLQRQGLKKILADVDAENLPMMAALKKEGFAERDVLWIYQRDLRGIEN